MKKCKGPRIKKSDEDVETMKKRMSSWIRRKRQDESDAEAHDDSSDAAVESDGPAVEDTDM